MSADKDWLKQNHHERYAQVTKTKTYIMQPANKVRMGFGSETPQGQIFDSVFIPVYNPYSTAYSKWKDEDTRTKADTHTFIAAEKALTKSFRKLYTGYIKDNELVNEADLDGMGLPQRSTGERHEAPVAKRPPDADIDTSILRQIGIDFFEREGTHKKAKPEGQHGAEAIWALFDAPREVHLRDLTNSSFDTHTPMTLHFEDEDRGKTLYFALRWENTTGEKGPWGDIMSAIVP